MCAYIWTAIQHQSSSNTAIQITSLVCVQKPADLSLVLSFWIQLRTICTGALIALRVGSCYRRGRSSVFFFFFPFPCGDALRLCVISANISVLLWRWKTLSVNGCKMKRTSSEKYPPPPGINFPLLSQYDISWCDFGSICRELIWLYVALITESQNGLGWKQT